MGRVLALGCAVVCGVTLWRRPESSALALFLCAAGLLLVDSRPRRSLPGSQVLLLAAFAAALLGPLGTGRGTKSKGASSAGKGR